jgi:hypothetical protein
MHSFTELIDRSTSFTLHALKEAEARVLKEMQTSGSSTLVKALQMIKLQKAIMAVGMFSIFEAIIQDRLGCPDGFPEAFGRLEREGEHDLTKRFSQFIRAINVLKHGRGPSYNQLLAEIDDLPFKIKPRDEGFFLEGDASEITTLVEVDDRFVLQCADVIRDVSKVIGKGIPGGL